jgi:hypothetical protein
VEVANEVKSQKASAQQLADIETLEKYDRLKNMDEKIIIGKIVANAILNKNCRKQLKLHCEIMKFRSCNYEWWEYAEMYISDLMRRKEVD